MDILKCKCMLYPTKMKIEDSPVGTLFGYECKRCGKSARAQSPIMAATLWNDSHGAQAKPLCLKCGKFTPVKDGTLCAGCMRKFPLIKVDAPTVGDGHCWEPQQIAQNHNKGQVAEPQGDFFAAVAREVEYSTVQHPWHNLRPGQIYDALKGENLELADAMLTEDYRQIMTEATHVAGMCKRIYEQAREAMRKKRVAG